MRKPYTRDVSAKLWEFIKHGSNEHEDWLWEALEAFRLNLPKPEKRG